MPQLSTADHRVSPPRVTVPRDYNAAWDLIQRNLQAGRELLDRALRRRALLHADPAPGPP